jgi:hypothetical protein
VRDLHGLSGAPIFACRRNFPFQKDGVYCLYAIQAWQNGRMVVGPLIAAEIARRRDAK